MSVSSTASVDSTSSSESNRPELKTPWMLAAHVDQSVKTFLRLRPWDGASSTSNEPYLGILNDTDVLMVPPLYSKQRSSSEYKFTRVFDELTTQSKIFEESCLPLLTPMLLQDNYKALVFSHGVTKSGKTHSIVGAPGQAGIIPRALEVLFDSIAGCPQETNTSTQYRPFRVHDVEINVDELEDNNPMASIRTLDRNLATWIHKLALEPIDINAGGILAENQSTEKDQAVSLPEGMSYSIWMSCAEIYSERIYDLLATPSTPPLRSISSTDPKRPQLFLTTDNATHQKYVQDLQEVNVRTLEEAMTLLRAGYRQRQLYSALTNKPAPKSHCIVTIKVLKTPQFGESALKDAAKGKTSISQLSIVDLAGSERTRTTASHARDSGNTDTSLMVLGHCLKVLRSNRTINSKNPQEVPFRQSKLTQLFQGSLEAESTNSQVCMIVNASPFQSKFDETVRTLEFVSTRTESPRTRIANPREILLSNAKRLSAISIPVSHQPMTVQTNDDSQFEHHPEHAADLSQDKQEATDLEIEDGKGLERSIQIKSGDVMVGVQSGPMPKGRDSTAAVSGSAICGSSGCVEAISDVRKDFDKHREAFTMHDKARDQEFETLNGRLAENVRKIEEQETKSRLQDEEIRKLKQALDKSDGILIAQETLHTSLGQEIESLKGQLAESERRREGEKETLRSQDEEIRKLKEAVSESDTNRATQEMVETLHQEIKYLTDQLSKNVSKREELEDRVQSQDEGILRLKQEMSEADANRVTQEVIHKLTVQSLEAEVERLGAELKQTRIARGEKESLDTKLRELEEELVRQTQALAENLNTNYDLLKVQKSNDQELTQLREALAASERKYSAMAERFKSSYHDQSTASPAMELGVGEDKQVALEKELALAKETIGAWDAWFATAPNPTLKSARVAIRTSTPELMTIASGGRLAVDKPLVETNWTKVDSVDTGALATIQDAGNQAAELAAQEEDFVEHIDQTLASQDDPHETDKCIREEHTEATATEQTPLPRVDTKNRTSSVGVKVELRPSGCAVITQRDFSQIIEIETDSDDDYHSTFNQRRLSARLAQTQLVQSSASSSRQSSSDIRGEKKPLELLDSKLLNNKRTSSRSRSLPGCENALPSPTSPRSQTARMTRSRYSLPNNPVMNTRARTGALYPPIKKTRLSTASRPSLIFKDSDTDEEWDQDGSEEDDNESLPSPHSSTEPAGLPQKPQDSGADTTGVQSAADSAKAVETVASQELLKLPIAVPLQGSNREPSQVSPNDEDHTMQRKATLADNEDTTRVEQSPSFYPEDVARQGLSQGFNTDDDLYVNRSPDFEPDDEEMQVRPRLAVGEVGVLTDAKDAEANDEYKQDFGADNEHAQDYEAEGGYAQDFGADCRMLSDESGEGAPDLRASTPVLIDDHVGTPVAELSPVRSLYPKLKSTTPSPSRQRLFSPLSFSLEGATKTEKQNRPSWVSPDARLKEAKARLESPDRSRSSSPLPMPDEIFLSQENPNPTTRPYVDDDSESDDGKRMSQRQVGDMNDDEFDDGKDLHGGATSEYDSAQESLYSEEAAENPREDVMEDKENDDPNEKRKSTGQLSAKTEGKKKATELEESTTKEEEEEDDEDHGIGFKKQEANTISVRPKSKKRKLRQQQTVFAEEMNERVDMFDQPATIKVAPRKYRNKTKNKML
ncbi:hypothetical protein BGZ95_002721 [Linnemannia exigua]|uniref:Kinesin motor domain-containing protein n=1 Tax=Linnemannia exigua TaxID=604196 RepID=A0AAD4D5I9_9FUNG|nr:hypothetical protein BGZ95_002721 [Linnemannia exigua]